MGINRRKKGEIPGKKPLSPKRKQETPEEKVLRRRARQNRRYHAMKAERAQTKLTNLEFVVEGNLSPEDIDSLLVDASLNGHVAKPEPVRGNYDDFFDAVENHDETPEEIACMNSFAPAFDIDTSFANLVLKEWRRKNREKLREEKKARKEKKKKDAKTKRLAKAMGVSVEELQEPLSHDIIEDIMSILIVPTLETTGVSVEEL